MAAGVAIAVIQAAPYALEALTLAQRWVETMAKGDDATEEDLEALMSAYEASKQRRDDALTRLEETIARKKAEGNQ